ncbi:MAG: hypothetical protein ACYSSO_13120 [Planctomycetota bacterium]|jgi:hypothetical protein
MQNNNDKQERTKQEIEEIVVMIRLELYNQGVPCGPQAIQRRMQQLNVRPLSSVRTIGRILARQGLTHGRTGIYQEDLLIEKDQEYQAR